MTTPIASLLFFVAWLMLLVLCVGLWRVKDVLAGKTPANGFKSGAEHGSPAYWRLNRAHLNAVENLPAFASLVLAGHLLGVTTGLFATLSIAVAAGRVGQTIAHVSSGRSRVVNVRFAFFSVQIGAMAAMLGLLVQRGMAG
ncbi:MAG: MAPEG family protein [Myxococcales bacterium]|nr:MAPEG family protein [Myxococcales bacterium]